MLRLVLTLLALCALVGNSPKSERCPGESLAAMNAHEHLSLLGANTELCALDVELEEEPRSADAPGNEATWVGPSWSAAFGNLRRPSFSVARPASRAHQDGNLPHGSRAPPNA